MMKIHKGNLLIALNHDVVSFKIADLFVDENKDKATVAIEKEQLRSMDNCLEYQVVSLDYYGGDELFIIGLSQEQLSVKKYKILLDENGKIEEIKFERDEVSYPET